MFHWEAKLPSPIKAQQNGIHQNMSIFSVQFPISQNPSAPINSVWEKTFSPRAQKTLRWNMIIQTNSAFRIRPLRLNEYRTRYRKIFGPTKYHSKGFDLSGKNQYQTTRWLSQWQAKSSRNLLKVVFLEHQLKKLMALASCQYGLFESQSCH